MYKDWPQIATEMVGLTKQLRSSEGTPEVMKAFSAMAQAAGFTSRRSWKSESITSAGGLSAARSRKTLITILFNQVAA